MRAGGVCVDAGTDWLMGLIAALTGPSGIDGADSVSGRVWETESKLYSAPYERVATEQ
jgi:hypothetical protein